MTNSNRIKLTWISFFSYALTGALVIVSGMVMGNIADYFHLPVSSMSNTFTFAQPQPGAVFRVDVRSRPGERDHHVDRDLPDHPYV